MSARHKFIGNALTLATGNIVAQIVTIALVPVITRIYSPEAFGYFSIFISVSVLITAVSSLRYSAAILVPEEIVDAWALVLLSLFVVIIMVVLSAAITFWQQDLINRLLNLESETQIILLVPLSVLFGGMWLVLSTWNVRQARFRRQAGALVASAVVDRTVSILLGIYAMAGPLGLVVGKLCGQIVLVASLFAGGWGNSSTVFGAPSALGSIRRVAIRYKRFPQFAWSSLVQQLSQQSPVILLGVVFSPAVAGFYALGRRILLEPIHIIGDAVAKSFFQRVSEDHRSGKDVSDLTFKLLSALAAFFIPPMVMFAVIAEPVFMLLFGYKWQTAGYYATLLTPMYISFFLLGPLSVFFDLLEKQKEFGLFNLVTLMVTVLVLVGGGLLMRPDITILMYSCLSTLIIITRVLWLASHAGVAKSKVMGMFITRIVIAVLFSLPLLLARVVFTKGYLALILIAMGTLSLYFVFLWRTNAVAQRIMSQGLRLSKRSARG